MIAVKQLFKLMQEHGMAECSVTDGERSIMARRGPPGVVRAPVLSSVTRRGPEETAENLDNSAAMPDYDGVSAYATDGIYGDPDLYPEGVDPVAELRRAADGIHPDQHD